MYIIQEQYSDNVSSYWVHAFTYGLFPTQQSAMRQVVRLKHEFDDPENGIVNEYKIQFMSKEELNQYDEDDLQSIVIVH